MSDQIEQLRAKYEYIYIVREQNKKQTIFKIPKNVFIKNILVYLEDGDLLKLSITCKFFSLMIYNPFTLRILLAVRGITKIPQTNALLSQNANQDSKNEDKKIHSSNNEDIMAQLETLKMVKEFMTDKVRGLEDSIKNHQKDLNQLKKDLFYERSQNIASAEKIQVLENKIQSFDIDKQSHGERVKELNLHYQKILLDKEKELKVHEEENIAHQKELDTLLNEVKKAREEQDKIMNNSRDYKYALLKMKKLFSTNAVYRQINQHQQVQKDV